jgi:hypothetical protein
METDLPAVMPSICQGLSLTSEVLGRSNVAWRRMRKAPLHQFTIAWDDHHGAVIFLQQPAKGIAFN